MPIKAVFLSVLFIPFLLTGRLSYAGEIRILTSFYPVYIMAKNVARDVPGVSVQNLTSALTGCLHDYTVTTNEMKKLSLAQVFIVNGAGMESFLDKVAAGYPDLKIIKLSEGIVLIKDERSGVDNPHVWVSISNAIIQVKNLGKAMEAFDPSHKELYEKNADRYIAKLEKLRQKMHLDLAAYKGRSIVTFHEAFSYFAQEFGFKIAAVIEREPGSSPSAKEVAETIGIIREKGVMSLFSEPQYPISVADAIAEETGAKVYGLDPAVTGPDDYDAYINIMEKNSSVLKEALGNK
ncbi:MAG: metal ABC transporter substrate-binding protein [Candidatus Omnitrophota bacterium]